MSFIDVWIFMGGLVVYLAIYPFQAMMRTAPRVLPGEGLRLPTLEQNQDRYERHYRYRQALRLVMPACLLYFAIRTILTPLSTEAGTGYMLPMLVVPVAVFLVSFISAILFRHRSDMAFVKAHSEFQGSLPPIWHRVGAMGIIVVPMALLVFGASRRDPTESLGLVTLGLLTFIVGRRLFLKALTQSRLEVPLDSPLGIRLAALVSDFGFAPKRISLIRTLVANGFALPDGTIAITTALKTLCTEDELAGVLAHELSHARDRDVRPIVRRRALLVAGAGIPSVVLAGFEAAYRVPVLLLLPTTTCLYATLLLAGSPWLAKFLHRLEFKCDQVAISHGLAAELASCLKKLHRYMGLPGHWVGFDRSMLSHPSLDLRLKILEDASAKASVAATAQPS